ncbi:hypothetical protein [Bowmanella denitrificans]|uniref:hypothetical protein n=1 Tax=Bowmanella denitrificans TaxID=366582 RepID=UPI000C9A12D7|nr:hypothetical protein [Bowmanella denitrificans]
MKFFLCIFILTFSFAVSAQHNCAGKVISIDLHAPGDVQITIEGIGTGNILCSLTQKKGLVESETCKAMFSLLLTAKATVTPVRLWFNNDNNTSCDKGNYQDLNKFGFYYLRLEPTQT